jgi:hypothetical protein
MITAISSTYSAFTNSEPASSAGNAADSRAQRNTAAAAAVDSTATQPATTASRNDASTDLRPEQRVGDSARTSDVEQRLQDAENQQLVSRLSARDQEVRAHEQAHQAAGGTLAGAASYTYQRGPDGQLYAVGGEVSIQAPVSSGDPQQDLENAQTILRAALAPAEPSTQDMQVAASARALATESRAALASERMDAGTEPSDSDPPTVSASANAADRPPEPDSAAAVVSAGAGNDAVETVNPESQAAAGATLAEQLEQQSSERERSQQLRDELEAQRERRAENLAEYQQQMAQVQERLAEINRKLAEVGVLDPEYLIGAFINDQA